MSFRCTPGQRTLAVKMARATQSTSLDSKHTEDHNRATAASTPFEPEGLSDSCPSNIRTVRFRLRPIRSQHRDCSKYSAHNDEGACGHTSTGAFPLRETGLSTQRCASIVGVMGAGSAVSPSRNLSTAAAAARPSAMAQTIKDWPRPISPATKTPGMLVAQFLSR
jgi:hypothetical protein